MGGSLWKHRFDLLIREFILGKEKGGIGVLMGTSKLGDASKAAKTLVCISPIPSAPQSSCYCSPLQAEPWQVAKILNDFVSEGQALPVFLKEGSPPEPQETENDLSHCHLSRQHPRYPGEKLTFFCRLSFFVFVYFFKLEYNCLQCCVTICCATM